MPAGDFTFFDGSISRGGLTFAVARKLWRECRHEGAKVLCGNRVVLWREKR